MDTISPTDVRGARDVGPAALEASADDAYRSGPDEGQTTAEYALVLLGVAAIAAVLIKWATSASGLTRLFAAVLRKLVQGVAG
jgi:hypothetical protein